jgi:RNA polymerase sigma factor (sigma-70 family)
MKLTAEEQKIVEQNHNLIYWYINRRGLDEFEWYGIIATELCLAVHNFDSKRGTLSTYFKIRCDNKVAKEIVRASNKHKYLEEPNEDSDLGLYEDNSCLETGFLLKELLKNDEKGVLELKSHGFTQNEIAKELNVSQGYVSQIISKARRDFYD